MLTKQNKQLFQQVFSLINYIMFISCPYPIHVLSIHPPIYLFILLYILSDSHCVPSHLYHLIYQSIYQQIYPSNYLCHVYIYIYMSPASIGYGFASSMGDWPQYMAMLTHVVIGRLTRIIQDCWKLSIAGWWFWTIVFFRILRTSIPTDEVNHFSEGQVGQPPTRW